MPIDSVMKTSKCGPAITAAYKTRVKYGFFFPPEDSKTWILKHDVFHRVAQFAQVQSDMFESRMMLEKAMLSASSDTSSV